MTTFDQHLTKATQRREPPKCPHAEEWLGKDVGKLYEAIPIPAEVVLKHRGRKCH